MTKPRSTPRRPLDDYDFPWRPLYTEEVHTLAAMLGNELGMAVLRLRAHAWHQKPRCTLPDSDATLARISGLGASWADHGTEIRAMLKSDPATGRLVDVTLLRSYVEQAIKADISEARKYAGHTGGERSAEARRAPRGSNGPSNRPTKVTDLLDPVIGSELQVGSAVENSEPGEATGQATGERVVGATTDWRELVDPARAASLRARQNGPAAESSDPPDPTDPSDAAIQPSPPPGDSHDE